jgi:hypothetical protein
MKAIGGMAISHPGAITWIERITTKPVVWGLMLGLGFNFVADGLGMMKDQSLVAIGAVILAFLLFGNVRLPAMSVILAYGIAIAFLQRPHLLQELSHLPLRFRCPEISLGGMTWKELLAGFPVLGLPPAPPLPLETPSLVP